MLGFSPQYVGPREMDKRQVDADLSLFQGWRNVLELQAMNYAISSRDGSAEALPLLIQEAHTKRLSALEEPDPSSPQGASADWDAVHDLESFANKAQAFVYGNLKPNLQPPKYNQDMWDNREFGNPVPKSPAQQGKSVQDLIDDELRPYLAAAEAALGQSLVEPKTGMTSQLPPAPLPPAVGPTSDRSAGQPAQVGAPETPSYHDNLPEGLTFDYNEAHPEATSLAVPGVTPAANPGLGGNKILLMVLAGLVLLLLILRAF